MSLMAALESVYAFLNLISAAEGIRPPRYELTATSTAEEFAHHIRAIKQDALVDLQPPRIQVAPFNNHFFDTFRTRRLLEHIKPLLDGQDPEKKLGPILKNLGVEKDELVQQLVTIGKIDSFRSAIWFLHNDNTGFFGRNLDLPVNVEQLAHVQKWAYGNIGNQRSIEQYFRQAWEGIADRSTAQASSLHAAINPVLAALQTELELSKKFKRPERTRPAFFLGQHK